VNERGSQCTCEGKGAGSGEKRKKGKGEPGGKGTARADSKKRGDPLLTFVSERGPVHLREKGNGQGEGEKNKIKAYHSRCGGRSVGEVTSGRSGTGQSHK
jgi:hypothetical protein